MKRKFTLMLTLLLIFQILNLSSILTFAFDNTIEKGYLVGVKKGVNIDKFVEDKGLNNKQSKKLKNFNLIAVDLNQAELQTLQNDISVLFIEPDSEVKISSIGQVSSNDEVSLHVLKSQTIPWGIEDIGVPKALENNITGNQINVAVLDTGISNHPDLKVAGGTSFVEGKTDYIDDNGHGTHVAGTIAAIDNKIGVVGAANSVKLYSVKVLDQKGSGMYSQVIQGIEWALDNKIDVISMSFGGMVESQALHDAIIHASNKGILFVAAAGNNGSGTDTMLYPAKYPEVVSVGAVGRDHRRASFSSTGPELDIVAPGVEIFSTTADGGYGLLSGTSMATPHVTGTIAALWSANRDMTPEEVLQKLYANATPLGNSHEYGHGEVDLDRALGLDNSVIEIPSGTDAPPVTPPSPDSNFNIIEEDQKLLELSNKLLDQFQDAKGLGEIQLMKDIQNCYNELLMNNIALHKLPEEYKNYSKTDVTAKNEAENRYFSSYSDSFKKLENSYVKNISEFENRIAVAASLAEAAYKSNHVNQENISDVASTVYNDNIVNQVGKSTVTESVYKEESATTSVDGQTDVNVNSYDFVGDGQTVAPGGTATVSLKLFQPQSQINIKVFNASTPSTIIRSTSYYNQPANTAIYYSWTTSSTTPTGTYIIRFTYPAYPTVVEDFTVYVKSGTIYTLTTTTPVNVSLGTGQYRVYKFTPGTEGNYTFSTGPYGGYGSENDTYLELYSDPNLTDLIDDNDDANGTLFSALKVSLQKGVTYYLKLRPFSSSGSVYCQLKATLDMVITPIYLDTPIDVDLAAGVSKVFRFPVSSTGYYKVYTSYYGGTSSSGTSDTVLYVFSDPFLTDQLWYNDDSNGTFSEIKMGSVSGGRDLFIKLTGFSGSSVHARITVANDPPPTYTTLDNKTPVTVDISKPAGQYAYYKFTPSVSGNYRFFTHPYMGTGAENDTKIYLFDDVYQLNQLAYNDDSGGPYGGLFSKIEKSLTGGKAYYLRVQNFSSSVALQASLTVEDDFDNSLATAKVANWDQIYEDNISSRYDVDYYKLTLTELADISLNVTANKVDLLNSSGALLDSFSAGDLYNMYSPSAIGTYYAKVYYNSTTASLSSNMETQGYGYKYHSFKVNTSRKSIVATPGSTQPTTLSWDYNQSHYDTKIEVYRKYSKTNLVKVFSTNIGWRGSGTNTFDWDGYVNLNGASEAAPYNGYYFAKNGNYLIKITPVDYPDISGSVEVNVTNLVPVVCVPGIIGTILNAKNKSTNTVEQAWYPDSAVNDLVEWNSLAPLQLQTDGATPVDPNYEISHPSGSAGLFLEYSLYEKNQNGFNGMIELVEALNKAYKPGLGVFYAPYDWRKDIVSERSELVAVINDAKKKSGSDKVDILSHSMGGVITKYYLVRDDYPGDVRRWVSAGAPFGGSAKAYLALEHGYDFDIYPIEEKNVKKLTPNFPSVFNLLPSASLVNSNSLYSCIGETDIDLNGDGVFTSAWTSTQIHNYLSSKFNSGLVTKAEEMKILLESRTVPSSVKCSIVIGSGYPTLTRVVAKQSFLGDNYSPIEAANGDKTVTIGSADWKINSTNVTKWYANATHSGLLKGDFANLLVNLVKYDSAPSNTNWRPFNQGAYALNGIAIFAASEAQIELVSENEQILNPMTVDDISYEEYTGLKMLYLPTKGKYRVKIKGIGAEKQIIVKSFKDDKVSDVKSFDLSLLSESTGLQATIDNIDQVTVTDEHGKTVHIIKAENMSRK